MRTRPVFNDDKNRLGLLRKLNNEVGLAIPEDRIDIRPAVDLDIFTDSSKLTALLDVFDWYLCELKRYYVTGPSPTEQDA